MRLYLLKYNNYYNRICKRELSIDGYLDYLIESSNSQTYQNPFQCNFNPNDGVSTTQVINWDGPVPDYVVCSVDGIEITSRWFVLECVRTRGTQFQLMLYRDTIADYYSEVMSSVTYIEKGMVTDTTNPLLYNAENMSFNQLKRNTTPLYDKSGCPWIVGFTDGGDVSGIEVNITETDEQFPNMLIASDGIGNFPLTAISGDAGKYALDYTNNSKIWFEFIQTTSGGFSGNRFWDYIFVDYSRSPNNPGTLNESYRASLVPLNGNSYDVLIDFYLSQKYYFKSVDDFDLSLYPENVREMYDNLEKPFDTFMKGLLTHNGSNIPYMFKNMLERSFNIDIRTPYSNYLDKDIIYVKDTQDNNKIYKFTKKLIPISNIVDDILVNNAGDSNIDNFLSAIDSALPQQLTLKDTDGNNLPNFDFTNFYIAYFKNPTDTQRFASTGRVAVRGQGNLIRYDLEPETVGVYTIDIPEITKLDDQPYSMFCMPYSDNFDQRISGGIYSKDINKQISLDLATAIQKKLTNKKLFDIQILPYCPLQNAIFRGTNRSYIDKGFVNKVTEIKYGPKDAEVRPVVGYVYWCKKSKFDFEIDFNISKTADPIDAKVNSMTDFYRLVSPAQGSEYKFQSEKIGDIAKMYVQCNYRPFNSSIRVVPVYQPGSLYYSSNLINSQEGLNIIEDMSLSQITDQWAQYELNNKNYRQTFQRSIDHMEFEKNASLVQSIIGMGAEQGKDAANIAHRVSSSIAAKTAEGATAGAKGGWVGAAVGAAAGLVVGTTGTIVSQMRANEAIDLTKDNFEYNLGNIKALPADLAKVSTLGMNNSWVPLLEYWSSTDLEKAIAKNKIIYNGMSINTIDNPYNYISGENCYFKGQLIRIEDIDDEFHVVNTIAGELSKGIYFN